MKIIKQNPSPATAGSPLKEREKGFTLIELIVVVTIIAVMTVVAVVNYGSTSKRARDGRRESDLQKVAMALEMYKQENNIYPATYSGLVSEYLQAWPSDPKGYSYYYARGVGSSYTYNIYAQMEDVGSTNGSYGNNCTGTCNYRISNP